jgi:hypothetical protein
MKTIFKGTTISSSHDFLMAADISKTDCWIADWFACLDLDLGHLSTLILHDYS